MSFLLVGAKKIGKKNVIGLADYFINFLVSPLFLAIFL